MNKYPGSNYIFSPIKDYENYKWYDLSFINNGIFEIEKWETLDKGETWIKTMITKDSKNNNVRPFVISSKFDNLFWMDNKYYNNYDDYKSYIRYKGRNLKLR